MKTWYKYECKGKTQHEISLVQDAVSELAKDAGGTEITLYWNNQVNALFLQASSALDHRIRELEFKVTNTHEEGDVNLLVLEQLLANY